MYRYLHYLIWDLHIIPTISNLQIFFLFSPINFIAMSIQPLQPTVQPTTSFFDQLVGSFEGLMAVPSVVLKHTPQLVVMTTVNYLLGLAQSYLPSQTSENEMAALWFKAGEMAVYDVAKAEYMAPGSVVYYTTPPPQ